jgi:hypothetical protein
MRRVTQPVNNQVKLASGLNVLAGIWEILAPFILGYSGFVTPTTNAIIVGLIVAVLAAIRYFGAYSASWLSWINAILGVWLIVAPFILGYGNPARTNDIIVGIIIAVLGTWSALASRRTAL